MKTSQKILISGLVGLAAGAAAGVLFAPDKGKKTRKKLARKAEDIKDSVEEMVETGKETIKEYAMNGAEKVKA